MCRQINSNKICCVSVVRSMPGRPLYLVYFTTQCLRMNSQGEEWSWRKLMRRPSRPCCVFAVLLHSLCFSLESFFSTYPPTLSILPLSFAVFIRPSTFFTPPSFSTSISLPHFIYFLLPFCLSSVCLLDHEECHTHKELMSGKRHTKNMFIQVR